MISASGDDGLLISRPGLDRTENQLSPTFRERPNYLLTNQIVGDVKMFISLMLKMTCDYYMPVVKPSEMDEMKEDLVETITNIILSKEVYKVVFTFFRLEFTSLEGNLRNRYKEFKHITPAECRVNEYFR